MDVRIIPVTPFQQNCTLLRCTATGKGAVCDPGGRFLGYVTRENVGELMVVRGR